MFLEIGLDRSAGSPLQSWNDGIKTVKVQLDPNLGPVFLLQEANRADPQTDEKKDWGELS
jgi:hypothetical protein